MSEITILKDEAQWRSRKVRYYTGNWDAVRGVMPEFELVPFKAGPDEPPNPFLQTVMRKPLSAVERPIPVGVVSHSYGLAQHREVATLCRQGLVAAGIAPGELRYEVGLSELGEWMNFQIYLPERFSLTDRYGWSLDLRLECFNSVDGSSRLVILFGWYRQICTNGLVIRETKIEIRERHGEGLDLRPIPERIREAMAAVRADRKRMEQWESEKVDIAQITAWADETVSMGWGKKAAARVYHICSAGRDVSFPDPFAGGKATEKPVRYLHRVPGAPERAETVYDVAQALSYVATHRNNAEERVDWQADIPGLLRKLTPRLAGVRAV